MLILSHFRVLIPRISQNLVNLAIHGPGTSASGVLYAVIKVRATAKKSQLANTARHSLTKDRSRTASMVFKLEIWKGFNLSR